MRVKVEEIAQMNIEAKSVDGFCRGDVDLVYSAAYEAIYFHKSIADTHRGES